MRKAFRSDASPSACNVIQHYSSRECGRCGLHLRSVQLIKGSYLNNDCLSISKVSKQTQESQMRQNNFFDRGGWLTLSRVFHVLVPLPVNTSLEHIHTHLQTPPGWVVSLPYLRITALYSLLLCHCPGAIWCSEWMSQY